MARTFGTEVQVGGFTLRGNIDRDHQVSIPRFMDFAARIVATIGMKCSHPPQVADYPSVNGKPSPGFIVTQPIIESAVVLDVWPPLQGLYVHIVSCSTFSPEPLLPLFREYGFELADRGGFMLGM